MLDELSSQFAYHEMVDRLDLHVVRCRLSVRSDPRLLAQMMRNLVSNAVKYTTAGKILVGCRRRGDRLLIEVWDTGIGIPADQLSSIFEEFRQLDNPARERSKGLGLGLAIVQRLAELLGHAIDVRSRPGKGSVFSVEVPLGVDERWRRDRCQVAENRDAREPSETILVVEDEPAVREMLELLLDGEGHHTTTAGRQSGAGMGGTRGDPAGSHRRRL